MLPLPDPRYLAFHAALAKVVRDYENSEKSTTEYLDGTNVDRLSYPDSPPVSYFEEVMAQLNMDAFPWSAYAAVDNIIVYSLFASKRNLSSYRSFVPARASDGPTITPEEGLAIQHECEAIPKDYPTLPDCHSVAERICKKFPQLLSESCVPIAAQCVVSIC